MRPSNANQERFSTTPENWGPDTWVPDTWVIVPCFNEERRLSPDRYVQFASSRPWVGLLFVNDGSVDGTLAMLDELVQRLGVQGARVDLFKNAGKAEAVRTGVNVAMDHSPSYVGYWDADLATPLEAVDQFRRTLMEHEQLSLVAGSRMPLMGRVIQRHPARAWIGRRFAQVASTALRFRMWDTQCGAKMFRCNELVRTAFESPFQTGWIFDVELLARMSRMLQPQDSSLRDIVYELPLDQWSEIPGSKVKGRDFIRAAQELTGLIWSYRLKNWHPDRVARKTRTAKHSLAGGMLDAAMELTQVSPASKAA